MHELNQLGPVILLQAGDRVLITCDGWLNAEIVDKIRTNLNDLFPDITFAFMDHVNGVLVRRGPQ